MNLVITEKNIAADKIAKLLCDVGKPQADSVYKTPCYRFQHESEDWVSIGLRGHILKVAFPDQLSYSKTKGWKGTLADEPQGYPAELPSSLERPPFKKKGAFSADGVKLKSWNLDALPYLVWAPIVKQPAEKELIRALKNLAKKADKIIIATDFDREGELIGSDALEMVQEVNADAPVYRARYSALTKGEIDQAFSNLCKLDTDLAAAGESRRYIDLIWGAVLTRYLSVARRSAFGDVRSAGRVQTPTLALVCAREAERDAFVPEDYWQIKALLRSQDEDKTEFKASHAKGRFKDEKEAQASYKALETASYAQVISVEKKSRKQAPPAPFNTTSLMAAASAEGLSPARTMRIAESLYMDGLISYPRVDNTVYPQSLDLKAIVKTLQKQPLYAQYCQGLLKGAIRATRGKQETTDHPPIHPVAAADPERLKPEEWKLYNLVARRFLATLGQSATIEGTKLELDIASEPFVASGDVLVEPGFRTIYPYGMKKDEVLPLLKEGDRLDLLSLDFEHKQTEPPPRYSQGRLIQEMEKAGLGTKATRHSIIERLYEVKYIKNDPIEPSQLGRAIIEALQTFAPRITTANMTAELEEEMNNIAEGKLSDTEVVAHSRSLLADIVSVLLEHTEDMSEGIAEAVAADATIGTCPKCGSNLLIKSSMKTKSRFIGCSAWPECDVTYPLPKDPIERVEEPCPICGAPQIKVKPFRRKPYIMCVDPKCPSNYMEPVDVGPCPECAKKGIDGRLMAMKSETTGKRFIRCTHYEDCGVSYPLPPSGEIKATGKTCEHCGAPVVDVVREKGVWTICVNMDCPAKAADKSAAKKTRTAATKKTSSASRKSSGSKKTAKK